jgi:Raf kinase inhibitor-like YbhB/YbcL family protein
MTGTLNVTSNAFNDGEPIPERYAFCAPCADEHSKMSTNISPQLSWSGAPAETKSFAVICVDVDVPTIFDDVNSEEKSIPADMPRQDFYHGLLVDVPATLHTLAEGAESEGLIAGGKNPGMSAYGLRGINDFTMFMASNPDMAGDYGGYDGPCPPWNDELLHRYEFRVYALDVESLGLRSSGDFRGPDVMAALEGHVLAEGKITGTYTQNPDVAS